MKMKVPEIKHIERDGKVIVNERCTCGHLQSSHNGLVHHGNCFVSGCACGQYTWAEFIYRQPVVR